MLRNWLIRTLGGEPQEVTQLALVLEKERQARIQENMRSGMDLQILKALIAIPLTLLGLSVLFGTYKVRHDPALVAALIYSVFAAVFLSAMMFDIVRGLLGDEELRIIASWPVKSNSMLLARLHLPLKNALTLAAFVGLAACLAAMFMVGTPLLTGLVLLLILAVFALALMLLTTAFSSALLWLLGLDNLRILVVLVGFSGMVLVGGVFVYVLGDVEKIQVAQLQFERLPYWLPTVWLGNLVCRLSFLPVPNPGLVWPGLALLSLLPILAFRVTGLTYTQALLQPKPKQIRAKGAAFYRLLTLGTRRPADLVLVQLCLAHARQDWRFRSEAMIIPMICGFMLASVPLELGQSLFADPFIHTGALHPSMFLMVIIMVPPLFALSLLSCSSQYKAAWILQMGQIPELEFRSAIKRLLRILFVLPFLLTLALIYLIKGVSPLHTAAHIVFLYLLADVMVATMQALFRGYPLSLPPQDEELALKMMPVFMMLEILGTLLSGFVYNVLYRWWWAYLLGAAILIIMRKSLATADLSHMDGNPSVQAPERPQEAPKETTPLIHAVKEGRVNTARLLLTNPNLDLAAKDEHGKTAQDWAEELGQTEILQLLAERQTQMTEQKNT